jgi:hypothetical protein
VGGPVRLAKKGTDRFATSDQQSFQGTRARGAFIRAQSATSLSPARLVPAFVAMNSYRFDSLNEVRALPNNLNSAPAAAGGSDL